MFLLDPETQTIHYFDNPQPVPGLPESPLTEAEAAPAPAPVHVKNHNDQAIDEGLAKGWTVVTDEEQRAITLKAEQARMAAYVPTPEANKAKRQALLTETDALAMRHVRQSAALTAAQLDARAKAGKAITPAQFKELETYAQALRDLPEVLKSWPVVAAKDWPAKPAFFK